MATYVAASNLAAKLIGKKGATATFTRANAASFDPVTQTETGASTLTFSMPALGIPPGRSAEFRIGSLERRNIVELHLAPTLGTAPLPGDKARWAGADWTVIWVDTLDPAADGAPYCKAYVER